MHVHAVIKKQTVLCMSVHQLGQLVLTLGPYQYNQFALLYTVEFRLNVVSQHSPSWSWCAPCTCMHVQPHYQLILILLGSSSTYMYYPEQFLIGWLASPTNCTTHCNNECCKPLAMFCFAQKLLEEIKFAFYVINVVYNVITAC